MDLFTHYIQIIILGIVEGVTEFLPISSTGHLLIAEHLMGIQQPDVFNVVIQAGAILAVVFIYWNKLMVLFGNLDRPEASSYLLKLFLAFVVTGVVGLALTKHFHLKLPETLSVVAWATLIGGFVILIIEFLAHKLYPHDDVSWFEAILIGLAQVLAGVFPGTSRSGATIMTGMAFGMKRPAATEFSFLVGIPTMFAASALDLWKARKDLTTGGHQLVIDIAIGFIVSTIVAFFVIKWLLRFVQSHTFNGFAFYRIILGGGLLIAIAAHLIPDVGSEKAEAATPSTTEAIATPAPEPAPVTNTVSTPAPTTDATSQPTGSNSSVNILPPPRSLPMNNSTDSSNTDGGAASVSILPPPSNSVDSSAITSPLPPTNAVPVSPASSTTPATAPVSTAAPAAPNVPAPQN